MRIEHVEWKVFRHHAREQNWLAVRVAAGDGAEGYFAVNPWSSGLKIARERDRVEEVIVGEDPTEIIDVWWKMRRAGVRLDVLGCVDVALWDLQARRAGCPAHALLGTQRASVAVYRSTPFNVGTPQDYADYALEQRAKRFQGVKIHATHNDKWTDGEARGDYREDIRIARAVREAVGDEYPLMWDNYKTYTPEEARTVGLVLEELNYAWYESPMPETDDWMGRYLELQEHVDLPICAPETHPGDHTARIRWMDAGATDMGRLDIWQGGITACWAVAQACYERGMQMDLHSSLSPHMQVQAATTERTMPYMEYFSNREPDFALDENGHIALPSVPGAYTGPSWAYACAHELNESP